MTGHMAPADFLRSRGIDPRVVEERGVALALPEDERSELVPDGYPLVFPLYGDRGEILSVLVRRTGPGDGPKSRSPHGYERRGLVMADQLGLYLLKHGSRPEWWTDDAPPLTVMILEGEIDFASAACEASDANEHAPAVMGVFNGSWGAGHAARIPDGCHVIIATDSDADGEKYAAQIVQSFEGRDVTLLRWRAAA